MTEPTSAQDLFKGRHFDQEIIVLWYLAFKLSSRDLVQMMAERGIELAHTTILRWVQRYVPEFEKRWKRYALPVGNSWRVDETYIKVRGQWVYLYRAVDKEGRTVDFLLSRRRDVAAAKRFFSRAAKQHGAPRVITLDGYAASHRAVDKLKTSGTLPRRVQVRSCKYLNKRDRARSPANKATGQADPRVQAIRDGGHDDSRYRTGGENQETTVQPQTTNHKSKHDSGNLGCGPGRLKSAKPSR
jgi:transposase-like protein